MGCYFVVFKKAGFDDFSDADTNGLLHSCLGIEGRASSLVGYSAITSGVSTSLPLGAYSVEVFGLYNSGADCSGQTVRQAFSGTTPKVFSLGSKGTTSFTSAAEISVPATYNENAAANLATTCSGNITSWKFVDGNGVTGLNYDVGRAARGAKLVAFNGKLYLAWHEWNVGDVSQIRVAVYNGLDSSPAWTRVDGNLANGINVNTSESALTADFAVHDGVLFLTWSEATGTDYRIRVATYNGNDLSPTWAFVGNASQGINHEPTLNATDPVLVEVGGTLFAAWSEQNSGGIFQVRVAYLRGTGFSPPFEFVDGDGGDGLNYSVALAAVHPHLAAHEGKLYATWYEPAAVDQVRVSVFNGNVSSPAWIRVDGGGVNGINKLAIYSARRPKLHSINSKLYASWNEPNSFGITQIRVAVYNGNDGSPSWQFVDGNAATGINWAFGSNALTPFLAPYGSKLFNIWTEFDGGGDGVRVKRYSGDDASPTWTSVDGNGAFGLNRVPGTTAYSPHSAVLNSKLYLAWEEGALAAQIRVVVGQ